MAMRSGTTRIRGAVRALLGALGRRPRSAGAATAALEAELAAVTARCERLEHALSFGEQVVYEWLPRTDTLSLSPNWYPLVGLPPGSTDSVGSFAGLVHPADRARAREAIVRALKHDEPHRVELRVRTQAHGERHMIVRGAVDRRDEHGRAERLLGTIVDVTERARSSERLALALNATHIGIGEWWPNGDRLALDESWYQLTGWPVGSVTSTAALATGAYIHPDDLETFGDFVEPVVSGRQDSNVTRYRMRLQSGEFRWVQASITAAERCPDGRAERIIGTVVDIHETADIETRLRVAVESGRQGLWQLQPQEDRLEPLTNWLELTGYDADEVTSMAACYAAGVIPPEDQPLVINEIEALTRGDRDETEIEFRIRRKSGEFFWALTRFLVSERDAAGQALRIVGVNIDITERRETEERLAVALETGRQATWSWDVASDRFEPDARWRRLFGDGQDQNETVRDLVQRIVHPDDRSRVEAITAASRSEGPDTGEAEFRLLGRDGRYLWVLLRTLVNARDAEGRPAHIVGTTVDITRLKEAEERTRRAAEAAQLGLWDWNLETDEVVFPDNLWPQLVGYPPERIRTAQDIVGIIHADDRASIAEAMAAITEGRYPSEWREVRYLRGDGTVMWVRVSGTVTERAPDGRPTRILGTSYDITDLKRTQQALEDERDRLELVIEGAEVGLWEYNFVSNGLRLNQRAATLFGEAVEDELRITLDDYTARIHDDDRAAFLGAIDEAVAVDGRFACDYRLRLPGDGWVWRHAAGRVSAWSEDGRPLRGAGTTIDVTERMERDAQLKTIADAMTRAPAGGLLQAAVRAASELCDSAPAFVGELDESGTGVSVIAAWPPDAGLEGLGYAIEATPCANVMDEDFCIYPERVAECFPEDAMLREMGVESYAGRRLVDERGRPNGMLIVYDTRPLANPDRVHSVLDILATTASNELARERSRRALIDSERRYRQIYERMPVLLCTLDQQQRVIDVNETWCRAVDESRERFLGRSVDELFTEESGVALKAALAGKRQPDVAQYLDLKTRAGDVVTAAFTVFGAGRVGNTDYRILALEDVTARLHAEEQLRIAATAFESHGAIAVADEARLLLEVNEAFTELTQYARVEAVGEGPEMLRSARHSAHFYRDIWDEVDEFGRWEGEVWTRRRNGSEFPAWQTITAVYDDQGQLTHYVINLIDITDRVRAEREIERLAYFDPLTGLANRRYLLDRLDSAIAAARRRTVHGALLFIDLDHFKQINDSMGHSIGDGVLMQVAERLQRLIRQEDVVCRLGGDEFVVLLGDTGPTLKASRAHVQKVAEKIGEVLSRPYVVDRQEFHITPTIGIASFPEGGDTPADLLKEADSAMYQGKTEGRNTWRFYDPAMAARATERMELENDLRGAVERDELELHFQPQIRAGVGIIGAEALLRWKHPERGYVSPEKFIAIAEDSTLIQDLGRWVVEHAMATAAAWIDDDLAFIDHLAINLSPRQFRSADFVAELEQMRADAGVPAHFIVLELTERAVIDDIDGTIAKMNQLRALGFRFSVDDFGIGYSSLAYLRRLPLDQLKIDRAFVLDVVDDANAGVIAETIIAMGHQLGLETIAEGIETEAQRDFLVARGCDEFQGYLYCRPLPDGDFRAFCAAYRAETATAG